MRHGRGRDRIQPHTTRTDFGRASHVIVRINSVDLARGGRRLRPGLRKTRIIKGNRMNKGELIDAVADAANLSKADANRAVDAMLDTITDTLKKDRQISLVGFGTFSVKRRAARNGRNPRTGETIFIAASNVPGFKAGKALKDAVN
ncbi:MAG: HU family DNA-binding protein [Gammaproteobacteria bacterium]|nr:HU family DNA-binding protein [Gammaproteobacteria bacterium]